MHSADLKRYYSYFVIYRCISLQDSYRNNFDQSTLNAPSAFWYNEVNAGSLTDVGSSASNDPGWTAFANGNTEALTNGKGFRILIRGDRTISLNDKNRSECFGNIAKVFNSIG